jgi:hypothetical protein
MIEKRPRYYGMVLNTRQSILEILAATPTAAEVAWAISNKIMF